MKIRTILAGACVLIAGMLQAPQAAASGPSTTYVVLYHDNAATGTGAVEAAGGTVVASYPQIGVVVARSTSAGFAAQMKRSGGVSGVGSTTGLGIRAAADDAADSPAITAATWGDSLSGLQWDMRQINVPQAHGVTQGSSSIVVGDLDTGLDFTHPDIAPNYDASRSTDCSSGAPQPLLPGNDQNGHGTHTAGTIAAAANGNGIVGVAPGVKIAGIKTSNDDGFFFPEMVVCAFMWAGTHGIAVTNNSYFADPWLYNCVNDADQRAIRNAERRAISFAQSRGVLVVASHGNFRSDLSHPHIDNQSPDNTTPVTREITNACSVVPSEVPGVVTVTATGDLGFKSNYSDYGIADVAAPGGDSILQVTPDAPNGRVLSTYPSYRPCTRQVIDPVTGAKYCYLQGTSMAGPHVAGVAALIKSLNPGTTQGALAAALRQATNPIACPSNLSIYGPFPQLDGSPQSCQGGLGNNSWYGHGEIDALKAVN